MNWIIVVLSCVYICFAQVELKDETHNDREVEKLDHLDAPLDTGMKANDQLNILLLSAPAYGHLNPLLAVGEELARRGHNVTLCIPKSEQFSEKISKKVARTGIKFVATGKSVLSTVQGSGTQSYKFFLNFPLALASESNTIMSYLDNNLDSVDIIIGEEFVVPALLCTSQKFKIPVMVVSSTLQLLPYTYPPWPWPGPILGSTSDDLSFLQRIVNTFGNVVASLVLDYYFIPLLLSGVRDYCPSIQRSCAAVAPGTHIPQIIPSAIGLEYARTIFPLVHYVGPVFTKYADPLPSSLHNWIYKKEHQSVIYVSMGSHVPVADVVYKAIIDGIATTNYSAVWAFRGNTDIIENAKLQPDKIFITTWAPQLTLLGHPAIKLAIVHGGFNGVHEALYNEVPIIIIPMIPGDQAYIAGRVHHKGFGVYIQQTDVSASSVSAAIQQIDGGNYSQNIKQLKKIFVQAGGVEKAADLVEYYEDVKYSHIIPAYAKYNWSFIQYYNIDVYLLLGTFSIICAYISWKCLKKMWFICKQFILLCF